MSLEILKKYGIRAKKALGQNFLINDELVGEIADIIEVEDKNIIEVGPGYGALTEKLLEKKPKSLHLVELDIDMIHVLETRTQEGDLVTDNIDFHIHNIDVLKYVPENIDYSVIANIPYYITSPILRHFLYDIENKPASLVILMQKDVGDRIVGSKKDKGSVIRLFCEKKCDMYDVLFVGKENFIPTPKIESCVLLFESHDKYNHIDDADFLALIKKGFAEPRKKLSKNLIKGGYDKVVIEHTFSILGLNDNTRAEELNIGQWIEFLTKTR